jgi:hypothetical protein
VNWIFLIVEVVATSDDDLGKGNRLICIVLQSLSNNPEE